MGAIRASDPAFAPHMDNHHTPKSRLPLVDLCTTSANGHAGEDGKLTPSRSAAWCLEKLDPPYPASRMSPQEQGQRMFEIEAGGGERRAGSSCFPKRDRPSTAHESHATKVRVATHPSRKGGPGEAPEAAKKTFRDQQPSRQQNMQRREKAKFRRGSFRFLL
jgi:hypothetical protein